MPGHGVGLEHVHDAHHVGALGLQRRVAALPGVAAIEQQHFARTFGADRLDQSCHAIETADAAIGLGQRFEIGRGQRVGVGAPAPDLEISQQLFAHEMRRQALVRTDTDVGRGLAEIERHELGVQVGEVQDGELADRLEAQQVVLGRRLALGQCRVGRGERCRRARDLKQLAPAETHRIRRPLSCFRPSSRSCRRRSR